MRIVNYGHRVLLRKGLEVDWFDLSPELIGKEGVVSEVSEMQGVSVYALTGLSKTAWYLENQLELIQPTSQKNLSH